MFPVHGKFGDLWYTTWQLCFENNSNNLGIGLDIWNFQLKFVSIYRKDVKIIAITYFLATLPILTTKIAVTRYLVIVLTRD